MTKCVLGYNPISDRLITICLQAEPVNISVVQAYTPTSTADDETINSYFHELQETINKIPNRYITIMMWDFKDLFRAVKEITRKKRQKLDVIKDEDGEILTECDQIKQRWQQLRLMKKDESVTY
ncbi:craniofacial development protein 2-like [Amphiura filiformis]|uniref:craniofacial development protein 2-like n=1 Tax=Amphiura filiformis TaxID=82378 RepID=UPI003B212A47